jgi:hypothetical protein
MPTTLTRAQQAYRQWIDTYIATKDPRHLKTAAACQRIATQELGTILAIYLLQRAQLAEARGRRLTAKANRSESPISE